MQEESLAFLKNLIQNPSPSGFERPVQDVVRAWAQKYADEVRTDRHGNVIAVRHPDGQPRIMLAGHCDQIGLMVQYIDDNGFLYAQPIGGWDMQVLARPESDHLDAGRTCGRCRGPAGTAPDDERGT